MKPIRRSSPLLKQKRRFSPQRSFYDSQRRLFIAIALAMSGLFAMTCFLLHQHLSFVTFHAPSVIFLRRPSSAAKKSLPTPSQLPPRITLMTLPSDLPYDIYHCPETPPPNYPYEWNILQVLDHWSIDDTNVPLHDYWHQGLCVFDARIHGSLIETYLAAEVPFVLQHHAQVVATAERWSTPGYLDQLLGSQRRQTSEHSINNHFMFWRPLSFMSDYHQQQQAPIDHVDLTFPEWHAKAVELEHNHHQDQATQEHWYFRINGVKRMEENMFLYEELPFFNVEPDSSPTWFMVEPEQERGINCRFGMKGAFAASHFDPTRNWITLLGGTRRYLLSNYTQCSHLQLYPIEHPSQRHSRVDWSHPREYMQQHPDTQGFAQATVNEVVLQAGDALYLPTSWFHAIVSLDINYQCNARSGLTLESFPVLQKCGFGN